MRRVNVANIALWALLLAACGSEPASGVTDAGASPDAAIVVEELGEEYIFDLGKFHSFEVEVSAADWQQIRDDPRLEEYVPAVVIFEGQRYEGAALRFKGGYGTLESCFDDLGNQLCPKLSMKLSFTKFAKGRFFGLRKLIFNSSVRDPTLMHDVVGYSLYRKMGVPAPRASHAKLKVNGEDLGVFVLVEQVDKEFIQEHFASDTGNLYKAAWPLHDTADPYIAALHTNEAAPDVSRMLNLQSTLSSTTDATFVQDVAGVLDLAALATYLAVDRAISNSDGIRGFYCYGQGSTLCYNGNYYWYEQPSAELQLIPWDLDYSLTEINSDLARSFNDPSPDDCAPIPFCVYWEVEGCVPEEEDVFLLPPQCDTLYGHAHRATWSGYLAGLKLLAAGPLSRSEIVPFVSGLRDKIREAVAADAFGPGQLEFSSANAWLDEVLEQQLVQINLLLAEEGL